MRTSLTDRAYQVTKHKLPLWATALAALKNDTDKGLGDTIARIIGPFGGDAFKTWLKSIGKPCNCEMRQEKLNSRFPYT